MSNVTAYVLRRLADSNMYLMLDRYKEYSIKSVACAESSKAAAKSYKLSMSNPLPSKHVVLNNNDNKKQLIDLICKDVIIECARKKDTAKMLIVTSRSPIPTQVYMEAVQ